MIAETPAGGLAGAAWFRLFHAEDHSYGFVDKRTPELTIGVEPADRGLGIGRKLLEALADSARGSYSTLSLSVEEDNAALHLYERVGFERRSDGGRALTFVLRLS